MKIINTPTYMVISVSSHGGYKIGKYKYKNKIKIKASNKVMRDQ